LASPLSISSAVTDTLVSGFQKARLPLVSASPPGQLDPGAVESKVSRLLASQMNDEPYPVVRSLHADGSVDPNFDPGLAVSEVLHLYRHLLLTRTLDEKLVVLQRQGRIGFHVGSLGEEAAIIGSTYGVRETDWIFPCYREFGSALLRGFSLQKFIDNMFGNANDTVQGRQMPDHYTCREKCWGSISSPVGTQITQAVGFAWAAKIDGQDLATLAYFGDGATSTPDFHSGMNLAAVFKIPTIFFCRNNGWAISVPAARQTASRTFAEKAAAYGMPGVRVDGNDLFAVVHVTRDARARALRGEGPTLIEALTSDDPDRYRGTADLAPWADKDPLERVRRYLERHGAWSLIEDEQYQSEIEASFRRAVVQAENTPPPDLGSMFEDVYQALPWHLEEQRVQLLEGPRAAKGH
jgi:pyruvate dehydrogenase E1 component alpha subunit